MKLYIILYRNEHIEHWTVFSSHFEDKGKAVTQLKINRQNHPHTKYKLVSTNIEVLDD